MNRYDKSIKIIESIVRKCLFEDSYDELSDKLKKNTRYVAFMSHRSMDRAISVLGKLPEYRFYSFWYDGQYYPMDEDSISKISGIKGVKIVNRLPKDLSKWQLTIDR